MAGLFLQNNMTEWLLPCIMFVFQEQSQLMGGLDGHSYTV